MHLSCEFKIGIIKIFQLEMRFSHPVNIVTFGLISQKTIHYR